MNIKEFIESTIELGYKPESINAVQRRFELHQAGKTPSQAVRILKREGY